MAKKFEVKVQRSLDGDLMLIYNRSRSVMYQDTYNTNLKIGKLEKKYFIATLDKAGVLHIDASTGREDLLGW